MVHSPTGGSRLTSSFPLSATGRGFALFGLMLAKAYILWLLFGRPGAERWPWSDEVVWMAMTAATATGCWQVLRRADLPPAVKRSWQLGVAAMLTLGVSLLLDAGLRATGATAAADVAGILGLLHVPLIAAALLMAPSSRPATAPHRAWPLDVVILIVSGVLLLWLLVMRSVVPPATDGLLIRLAAFGFPIAQFVALCCVAAVWLRRPDPVLLRTLACITIALGATLAGDLVYSVRLADVATQTPLTAELAWLVGAVAGLLAPAAQLHDLEHRPARRSAAASDVPSITPYVVAAGAAAGLLLTTAHWHDLSDLVALAGMLVVLVLVLLRQWIAHREHADVLEARAHSDARYAALVESASDIVAVADADGVLRFVSPSVERVLGYAPSAVVGTLMHEYLHPDEREAFSAIIQDLLARGDTRATPPSTWRVRRADGGWANLQSTAINRLMDPAVDGVILNGRDVTTQLDLEERLRQARQMEAIGRFASVIAHDFNHVLSAIKLNVQLQRDLPDDAAATEEILTAVELGTALTRQLMTVSQHRSTAPVLLDLGAVLRETERAVLVLVGGHASLQVSMPPEPVPVRADANQLRQVLMNLIINARDAAPGGTIRVDLRRRALTLDDTRRLVGLKPGPHAILSVEDDGTGMTPEVLQRLFEPFFTTKTGGRGTGLGLTIVYGIVTAFGGVIEAASTEGLGSRFEIFLPIALPSGDVVSAATHASAPGRRSILVVDDDPAIRSALQRAFALRGHRTLLAEDGQEALERLRAPGDPVHLILTDMRMPRLDGPGLIEIVAREWPTIPILGMSGFPHAEDHARIGSRVRRIVEKPFTLDEVHRAVDEALS